jgi:RNA-directed DNA polymerase
MTWQWICGSCAALTIIPTAILLILSRFGVGPLSPYNTTRTRPLPGARLRTQAPPNLERLRSLQLPELKNTDDVLRWLDLTLSQLVPLANASDRTLKKTNYIEWTAKKKRGGVRVLCAPKPRLKRIQRKIKEEILDRIAVDDCVHGFVRQRSIVSNATPHVGCTIVINLDLVDFFGHVHYPRVMGVFRRIGYGKDVSRWLALLCTYRPRTFEMKNVPYRDIPTTANRRHAVQGAPTSPLIANLAARKLDRRLAGLAKRFGCNYTRYADDLTCSGDEAFKRGLKRFLPLVHKIIHNERFRINHPKQRVLRPGRRQDVTGVVVNRKINVRRDEYDRLKAIIHNAEKAGLESQNRDGRKDFRSYLLGRAAHVAMLNPERGARLTRRIRALA